MENSQSCVRIKAASELQREYFLILIHTRAGRIRHALKRLEAPLTQTDTIQGTTTTQICLKMCYVSTKVEICMPNNMDSVPLTPARGEVVGSCQIMGKAI